MPIDRKINKNEWSYASTTPCAYMSCPGTALKGDYNVGMYVVKVLFSLKEWRGMEVWRRNDICNNRFFTETWHTDGKEIPSWRRSLHNTLENNYGVQSCPSFWWHNHATLGCALQENEARFCHQGYCPLYLAHVVHMQHPKSSSDGSRQWSVAVQKWGHTAKECKSDHGRR